jgi:hypothetical protein
VNNKLYDALENCLQALERGQTAETALKRYPDLAQELRPLIEASIRARTLGKVSIPVDVQRRGRTRLLQYAAQLRESGRSSGRRTMPAFSRVAIVLGLASIFVLSSTGLVGASSGALPGDQLYPVKRTWEGLRLFFVVNPGDRDILESKYEQERLDEIDELLTKGRSAPISFFGLVTKQQNGQWLISGIPVSITASTRLPADAISDGAPVLVIGLTLENGVVEAQEIQLLQPGVRLPPFEPSEEDDRHNSVPAPIVAETPSVPEDKSQPGGDEHKSYQFSGVVESMEDGVWNINGQPVTVDQAQINGKIMVGSVVKFEGYYDQNGQFIVTKIEAKSNRSPSKGDGNGGRDGGGEDSGDDH